MTTAMTERTSRRLWPVLWTASGLGGLIALLVFNATAREVAAETARTLFGIFATPFILETTVALFGLFIVLAINRWRLAKEGDGWVYLMIHEPEPGSGQLPAAISQRLQSMVMQEKPEAVDEAATLRAKIEGFLELGMAAQSAEALAECGELPDDAPSTALRVRVLAANLDTTAAQNLLSTGCQRFPAGRALFVQTAWDCAAWLEAHAPRQASAAGLWRSEAACIVE